MTGLKSLHYELVGPRTLLTRETALDATPLGAGEILAATEYSLVSPGTELAAWSGKKPLRPSNPYPRLVGYCNLARVVAAGAAVAHIRPGDLVLTHQSHRSHFRCAQEDVLFTVRDAGAASRPEIVSAYLFHLGYAALVAARYEKDREVAVMGFGALGFTTAAVVVALGGAPLVVTNRAIELPASLARVTVAPRAGLAAHENRYDLVVNSSDSWADYRAGLSLLRHGGTLALVGFPGRDEPPPDFNPLDSALIYDRQLAIQQVGQVPRVPGEDPRATLRRNLEFLLGLIAAGKLDPSPLLGWQIEWTGLAEAYRSLEARIAPGLTVLLRWQ